jgi:hypothetical protein
MQNFSELMLMNTAFWSSSVSNTYIPVSLSEVGKDMLSYGKPILVIDKAYQALSTSANPDVPFMPSSSMGTGDPTAMCFINGGLADRNFSLSLSPKGMQILNVRLAFSQESSTHTAGNTFCFTQGLLVAST